MCQDGWREAEDVGGKGGSKGPSTLSWDLNFDRKAMVRILEGSDLLRYELLKTLGQLEGYTGRRVRAEGEQEPPFLLPSSYPRCCSFLATVLASVHPSLGPLFLHLVLPCVPIGTFHSLPP